MKVLSLDIVSGRRGPCRDFVVSGRSLLHEVERRGFDLVPRLGSGLVPVDQGIRAALLLEAPGDTVSGRVGLYVCPLCGDFGCGLISTKVERRGEDFIWSDFARETNFADDAPEILQKMGPFLFDGANYRAVINGLAGRTREDVE